MFVWQSDFSILVKEENHNIVKIYSNNLNIVFKNNKLYTI